MDLSSVQLLLFALHVLASKVIGWLTCAYSKRWLTCLSVVLLTFVVVK